jgi:hypothetical protein
LFAQATVFGIYLEWLHVTMVTSCVYISQYKVDYTTLITFMYLDTSVVKLVTLSNV